MDVRRFSSPENVGNRYFHVPFDRENPSRGDGSAGAGYLKTLEIVIFGYPPDYEIRVNRIAGSEDRKGIGVAPNPCCMTVNSTVRVPAERKHPQPARLRVSFCRLLSCQAEIPEISVVSDGHAHPVLQFPDFFRGEVYAIADHAGISIPSQRQFLTIPHMSVQISPRIKGRISSSTMNSRPGPTGPAWRRYSACCSVSLLPRSEGISSRYVG